MFTRMVYNSQSPKKCRPQQMTELEHSIIVQTSSDEECSQVLSSSVCRKMQTPMSDAASVIKSPSSSGSAEFVAKAASKRIVESLSQDVSDESSSSSSSVDGDSSSSLFDKESDSSESSPVAVSDTSPLVIKPMAVEQSQDRLFGSMMRSKKRKVEFQTGERVKSLRVREGSGVAKGVIPAKTVSTVSCKAAPTVSSKTSHSVASKATSTITSKTTPTIPTVTETTVPTNRRRPKQWNKRTPKSTTLPALPSASPTKSSKQPPGLYQERLSNAIGEDIYNYVPSLETIAVKPTAVSQFQQWIQSNGITNKLCILTGPTGCGKVDTRLPLLPRERSFAVSAENTGSSWSHGTIRFFYRSLTRKESPT